MSYVFETPRLTVRQFVEEDAEALARIANSPHILKWMPDWGMPVEGIGRAIRYFISRYAEADGKTARIMLAVTLTETGELIGMVGIGNKEEVDDEIEIAYFVDEWHCGKGYMTEAVRAVSRGIMDRLKPDYLIAVVEPDNVPSQKIVERCGFRKIGTRVMVNEGETEEKPFFYYRLYPDAAGKVGADGSSGGS